MRLSCAVAGIALAAVVVAACSSSGAAPSQANAGVPTGAASPSATFPLGPVPGNSVQAPLPTDAPTKIRTLSHLFSCGAEVLFEEDVDITPVPTPPGPITDAADNQLAVDCLMAAWENGLQAEVIVSETTDEADQIFTIYRLPGNGTLQLVVRVLSHADHTVAWTETICRELSLQGETLTPADCDSETVVH
jgi:hypothetical protein